MNILSLVLKNLLKLVAAILIVLILIFGITKLHSFFTKDKVINLEESTKNEIIEVQTAKYLGNSEDEDETDTPKDSIDRTITKTGTILAGQEVSITPEITGNIKQLYVKEGSLIKKGDIIATLENSTQLKNSMVSYSSAINLLKNAEQLLNLTAQSGQVNLSTFEEQFRQAQLSIDKAAIQLSSTQTVRYNQFEVADINTATTDLQTRLTELNTNATTSEQTREAAKSEDEYYAEYLKDAIKQNQDVSKVKSRELEILQGQVADDQNFIGLQTAELQLGLLSKQMQSTEIQNQTSIVNAQNQIIQIRQQVESAKLSLSQGEIRSPINGMIANLNITNGSRVNPGESLVSVVNFDELKVKLYLSPSELEKIATTQNQNLKIEVEVLNEKFEANINYLGLVANPQTRTIPVELTPVITSMKGKNKFIPNTFAKAKFHITEKQVIARNTESNSADSKADIPLSALSKNGNEFQVAVADNGVAKLKPVTIEMQLKSSKVKIISGINVGDEIILNPTSIKNGSKITIK